jgi:predicted kinase
MKAKLGMPKWARARRKATASSREVVIVRGISGSGKTTYVAEELPDAFVISSDALYVDRKGDYKFQRRRVGEVHEKCLTEFRAALGRREQLIAIDKCNLSWAAIKPYVQLATEHGYKVSVVTIACDVDTAFRRNVHGTPRNKIQQMHRALRGRCVPYWVTHKVVEG